MIEPTSMGGPVAPDLAPVGVQVARLSAEFGDDAPHASQTRVLNMQRATGLGDEALTPLLEEAAAITRSQAPVITKRGRGGTVIRMPYLLATLQGLAEMPDAWTPAALPPPSVAVRPPQPAPDTPAAPDADDPVPTEAEALWGAVQGEVQGDLTAENYAAWFVPTRALAVDGDVLRVMVPTPFHRQWLEHKLRGCVDRALGHTGHAGVRIVYDVMTPGDVPPAGDRTIAMPAPLSAATPRPSAPARVTLTAPPVPHPHLASSTVPPPLAVCPSCRAAPCRCRLRDQLRQVVASRMTLAHAGVP